MSDDWLIYHEEPITLHSGGKSHWFVDGQRIFNDPHLRESVLACWERYIFYPALTHLIAIPRGGISWAKAFADRIGATWGLPDDVIPGNPRYVYAVDDVMTTGASLKSVKCNGSFVVIARRGVFFKPEMIAWAWIDLELEEAAS